MFRGRLFLEQCDPRAKLLALFLVMPILLTQPINSGIWATTAALSMLVITAGLMPVIIALLRKLLILRWFFATLLLVHGFFTPGQPIWPGWDGPTWDGLYEGLQQSLRLVCLVSLSWILVHTTTPTQLLTGLYRLLGGLEKLGLPIKRGFAMMAFALGQIPHFVQESRWIGEDLQLRLSHSSQSGWRAQLQRTAQGGEALIFRLFWAVRWQEEALYTRGFTQGLPFPLLQEKTLGWRDYLLVSLSILLFLDMWWKNWV